MIIIYTLWNKTELKAKSVDLKIARVIHDYFAKFLRFNLAIKKQIYWQNIN
jgi:hypothetical protein